jgi:ribosomal-protein-alanine N-acetyltransferase
MNWFKIRRAISEDAERIAELEHMCFSHPWPRADIERDIADNILAVYMTAETGDNGVIAYAGLWVVVDEAHITNVAVHPDWRGKGIASMLLLSLLDAARDKGAVRHTLEVRVGNAEAIALYEKLGFRIVGRREKYYENSEDAAIMWRYD